MNPVLLVFAFVFFVISAFLGPWYGRVRLGWLGLACYVATLIRF